MTHYSNTRNPIDFPKKKDIPLLERFAAQSLVEYEGELIFSKEKFAELIVQECCSKLEEMGEGWHEFAKNPPDGQAHNASGALFAAYRLKEDAVDEIKQHFGVEE